MKRNQRHINDKRINHAEREHFGLSFVQIVGSVEMLRNPEFWK